MTKLFNNKIKKILEDFNVYPKPLLPRTHRGPSLDWGRTGAIPSGFKGDSHNTGSMQIIFAIPAKKKKKSPNVLKKRVSANRVRR